MFNISEIYDYSYGIFAIGNLRWNKCSCDDLYNVFLTSVILSSNYLMPQNLILFLCILGAWSFLLSVCILKTYIVVLLWYPSQY